jgi:hypothetical protein
MTPQDMKVSMVKELQQSYNLDEKTAIEMAMFAVDRVINYADFYSDDFWMDVMEGLDNDRLTRK